MRLLPFKNVLSSCFVITKLLSLTRDCQYVQSSRQRLDWANMQVTGSLSYMISLWLLTSSVAQTHVRSPGANQEDWRCCQGFTFILWLAHDFAWNSFLLCNFLLKCAVHTMLISKLLCRFLKWRWTENCVDKRKHTEVNVKHITSISSFSFRPWHHFKITFPGFDSTQSPLQRPTTVKLKISSVLTCTLSAGTGHISHLHLVLIRSWQLTGLCRHVHIPVNTSDQFILFFQNAKRETDSK